MSRPIVFSTKKRKPGRPRTNPVAQHFTMLRELSDAVDAWREAQPDNPSRPEAIRRLLEIALAVQK